MQPAKVLVIPGSNRSGSYNAKLAGTIAKALVLRECEVSRVTLRDYEMPVYDADLEARDGQPENARKLARLINGHDAVVLVSPEYNASVPPLVKNTLDWVSRVRKDGRGELAPFRDKLFALASASPGKFGGMRGLYHLRATLMACGALILTEQLSVSFAARAFDDDERLANENDRSRLDALCNAIADKVSRFSSGY
jgi:chromate reductase, NAD(P)H dehydrogenase (quinone)